MTDNVAGVGRDAVVGVAPYNRDSGPHRGKRTVWGGRSRVYAVLYMGALVASRWNPVIPEFYQRLLATVNPKKLAITACMRKLLTMLNSMMRTGERWDTTIGNCSGLRGSEQLTAGGEGVEALYAPGAED